MPVPTLSQWLKDGRSLFAAHSGRQRRWGFVVFDWDDRSVGTAFGPEDDGSGPVISLGPEAEPVGILPVVMPRPADELPLLTIEEAVGVSAVLLCPRKAEVLKHMGQDVVTSGELANRMGLPKGNERLRSLMTRMCHRFGLLEKMPKGYRVTELGRISLAAWRAR